jgi:hypothetical protein
MKFKKMNAKANEMNAKEKQTNSKRTSFLFYALKQLPHFVTNINANLL